MDDRKQKKTTDNKNRLENKGRKKYANTPIKQFAEKIIEATGLNMYLKEETYKENVAKSRKKKAKDKQENRNNKRP